jgi:hypothetical protein
VNLKVGDHFYTDNAQERDNAISHYGYTYEGIACYVYSSVVSGTTAFYRLVNLKVGDHFYTDNAQERDNAISHYGYTYEGIACYVLTH